MDKILKALEDNATLTPEQLAVMMGKETDEIKIDYAAVLAERVRRSLGRPVAITGKGKKRKLELYYEDEKDLEELICKLCGKDFFNE